MIDKVGDFILDKELAKRQKPWIKKKIKIEAAYLGDRTGGVDMKSTGEVPIEVNCRKINP